MVHGIPPGFEAAANALHDKEKQKATKLQESLSVLFKGACTLGAQAASSVSSLAGRCSRNFEKYPSDKKVLIAASSILVSLGVASVVSPVLGIAAGLTVFAYSTYNAPTFTEKVKQAAATYMS